MGPLRGGLILSLLASPAFAEVCDKERPDWDGIPATQVSEAIYLFTRPISLFLLAALATSVIVRHALGTAIAVLLWGFYITALVWPDATGITASALREGCQAPPSLFIAIASALCVAAVLFTHRTRT